MSTLTVSAGFTRNRVGVRRPVRASVSSRTRLTRRGRIVLTGFFLAILLAAFVAFGAHSAATGESGVPVLTQTVEVGQGDTLWGIASQVAEPGEVREMIHRIEELNALSGPAVAVGQEIAIPMG